MRYAVIDIGANTVRLQIYDLKDKDSNPTTLFSKKMVAGLVTYIEDGKLSDKGCKKLVKVLSAHLNTVKLFNVKDSFVFATASLRLVTNLKEVKKLVKNECKIDLMILSQEEEAKLGYAGIQLSCNASEGFTVDIGGGSTEIVQFKDTVANVFLNLGFGSLSIYKNYVSLLLPNLREVKKIERFVQANIKIHTGAQTNTIFGIGGTMRAIGNILSEFLPDNSNMRFSYNDILFLYKNLLSHNKKLFKTILQVSPERVHTITPGTIIVKNILEEFHANEVIVCNTGLRGGVLISNIKR